MSETRQTHVRCPHCRHDLGPAEKVPVMVDRPLICPNFRREIILTLVRKEENGLDYPYADRSLSSLAKAALATGGAYGVVRVTLELASTSRSGEAFRALLDIGVVALLILPLVPGSQSAVAGAGLALQVALGIGSGLLFLAFQGIVWWSRPQILAEQMPGVTTERRRRAAALVNLLSRRYNLAELKGLAFQIGVVYEDLPARTRSELALELVRHAARRGRLEELVQEGRRSRLDISWHKLPAAEAASGKGDHRTASPGDLSRPIARASASAAVGLGALLFGLMTLALLRSLLSSFAAT